MENWRNIGLKQREKSSARRAAIKLEKMKRHLEMGNDYDEDSGKLRSRCTTPQQVTNFSKLLLVFLLILNMSHENYLGSSERRVNGRGSPSRNPHHTVIPTNISTHEDHEDGVENQDEEDDSMDDFNSDDDYLSEDENMIPSNSSKFWMYQ